MARPRGNRWQADAWQGDKRIRKSFRTREEAEAFEVAMAEGLDQAQAVTLGPFIDEQFNALWGDMKAVRSHEITCGIIKDILGADTLLSSIDARRVDQFIDEMRERNVKNATINRKLSALSKILRRAAKHGIIPARPEIEFLPEDGGRDRVLSREEETKARTFFEHTGLTLSGALFDFLLYTGCRLGEAMKAKRTDKTDAGGILFADRKNKKRGGMNTIIPLAGPALDGWNTACRLSNHDRPFGDAMTYEGFYGHWRLLKKHLGVTDETAFVPHMLRHTCCTRLVSGGLPLVKAQKWMGHKSIQTTLRYSHLVPKDLDEAADILLRAS